MVVKKTTKNTNKKPIGNTGSNGSRTKRSRKPVHKKPRRKAPVYRRFSKRTWAILIIAVVVILLSIVIGSKVHRYYSIPQSQGSYSIKGVDVSAYQGDIDWDMLYRQNIAFAYIKASEGSRHVDKKFAINWKNVRKTNIRAGAYHFMSMETAGKEQAKNFLAQLTRRRGMLPPVIDVEFYGKFSSVHPDVSTVHSILTPLLQEVKKECGMDPILYTSKYIYKRYISGYYDNRIWIADEGVSQTLPDGRQWTFCQYSFSGRLKGYTGGVKSIDLDVYNGDRNSFFRFR